MEAATKDAHSLIISQCDSLRATKCLIQNISWASSAHRKDSCWPQKETVYIAANYCPPGILYQTYWCRRKITFPLQSVSTDLFLLWSNLLGPSACWYQSTPPFNSLNKQTLSGTHWPPLLYHSRGLIHFLLSRGAGKKQETYLLIFPERMSWWHLGTKRDASEEVWWVAPTLPPPAKGKRFQDGRKHTEYFVQSHMKAYGQLNYSSWKDVNMFYALKKKKERPPEAN